jgi:lysophospholipase L1-like esterase
MDGKGKGIRRAVVPVACAALALSVWAGPAQAQTTPLFAYGEAARPGTIYVGIIGPTGATATISEQVGGRLLLLRQVRLDPFATIDDLTPWRCDRRVRHFVVSARSPDGAVQTTTFEVRTPSCRERLAFNVPGTVRVGGMALASLGDRWGLGGVRPRLCAAPPRGRFRCRTLRIRPGRVRVDAPLRLDTKGTWRIEVRLAGFTTRRKVHAGEGAGFVLRGRPSRSRVLLTGDSMMVVLDSVVVDRILGRMETRTDTRAGTGISKPGFSWISHARRQMARHEPDVTVVFLGANDGFDMTTPDGVRVACCAEPWIAEYARRAGTMMRIYNRGGAASSIWLTIPAPRSERTAPPIAAVDTAIRWAAGLTPGVRVLDLEALFSPGAKYRETVSYRGRRVRVRADDGLHLSVAGAEIAAALVVNELNEIGLLQ